MNKIESLKRSLARLEVSLEKEMSRLTRVSNNIPWGAGMRKTKCTPSFRREDELREKIQDVKDQLKELNQKRFEPWAAL